MNQQQLIELDLDRIKRLGLGKVSILEQSDVQVKYELKLADPMNPSAPIDAIGKIQALFGARLLSAGSHIDKENGNCVDARVCLQDSRLTVNQPAMASAIKATAMVRSILYRAKVTGAIKTLGKLK